MKTNPLISSRSLHNWLQFLWNCSDKRFHCTTCM